jgi:translation initiation factor IF-2
MVVVMGHIDHGKSTLLDYIRKANTTEAEKGGITQHLAAYRAEFKNAEGTVHQITFLDTPGHAAFSSIRERSSRAADIAILVVSAEDGVKPQTVEAIEWIKKDKISFIVAINKIDKPNANVDKVKTELAEKEILLEGWGGSVPAVAISAKTGEGVDDLLETLILQAEVDGISFDPEAIAEGFVIESSRDAKKGISATLIVKNGTRSDSRFAESGGRRAMKRPRSLRAI